MSTDDYEIIEMKGGALQPKEVIDLKVVDESESKDNKFIVVRLTQKCITMVVCLIMFIVITLVAIGFSVHYIFHL